MNFLDNNIVFSSISGYNYYTIHSKNNDFYIANHFIDGIDVEIKFSENIYDEKKWRHFLEFPTDIQNILWPIDIVECCDQDKVYKGLVFRRRAFPKMELIKKLVYNDQLLDWRKNNIQKIVINILKICVSLQKSGYAYHNYNFEHIFYNPQNMQVLFDFIPSITRIHNDIYYTEEVSFEDFGIECLPPWMKVNENNYMDLVSDYYSITVLIFRLMIGRMPYQGRLMDAYGQKMMNLLMDKDKLNHEIMFKEYLSHPIFIFENSEHENTIGDMTNEERFVERWETLPECVKTMFTDVLSQKNIEQKNERRKVYSPEEWLKILKEKCFEI